LISATFTTLTGVLQTVDIPFPGGVLMASGSLWKLVTTILDGAENYYPEDMTATYQLRYANGAVRSNFWSATQTPDGIGFWNIDGTLVVQ
jgi:hypothetical protein